MLVSGCSGSGTAPSTNTPSDDDDDQPASIVDNGILNSENANAVILQAFEVFSGRAYDHRLTAFPYTQAVDSDDATRYASRDCQNDGAVVDSQSSVDNRIVAESVYVNCYIDGDTLDGRVQLVLEHGCCEDYRRTFSDDFRLTFEPGGAMNVSGDLSNLTRPEYINDFAVDALGYYFSYPYGTLAISDATTRRWIRLDGARDAGNRFASMSGAFAMTPPVLGGASVDVDITHPFANGSRVSQLQYEQGRMTITAADSAIVLDAGTGDVDDVTVTVTTPDGDTLSRTENWSVWQAALAFTPPALLDGEPLQPADGDGAAIGPDNFRAVLGEVFAVYSGERLAREMLAQPEYPEPAFPWEYYRDHADGPGETIVNTCDQGGTVQLTPYKFGYRQVTTGWNFDFDTCDQAGRLLDGDFELRDFGNVIIRSTGLHTTTAEKTTEFSGKIDYQHTANRDGGPARHLQFTDVAYRVQEAGSETVLTDASFYYEYTYPYKAVLNGGFALRSPATGNVRITVSTPDTLVRPNDSPIPDTERPLYYFETGLLLIDAGNGNTLQVDPAGGDADSFSVTLTRTDQEPQTIIERWLDWETALDFNYGLYGE